MIPSKTAVGSTSKKPTGHGKLDGINSGVVSHALCLTKRQVRHSMRLKFVSVGMRGDTFLHKPVLDALSSDGSLSPAFMLYSLASAEGPRPFLWCSSSTDHTVT
jgi:hypothetical protein